MPARPEAGDEEMEGILYLLQEFKGKVVLFGISDVVDIAIMAFLIYKVIMLMRRTNSGAVAKGVLLLLFALGVSTFFHLNTVSYLLQQLMVWGVVALVVIFQPEIRRFLEQMGRTSLGKVFTPEEARNELDSAITQTVDAYMSLSKSKTGALMVFERKNMLDDAIKTGTALDCTVNAELLKNIFWNKAPLHDGAVIVRAGRIVGAGCMLPMSGNVNLSRELGMRHRAGIGASEHTDAVVAIVSEETGSISVAVGGMLKRHLAPETLERLLRNELLPERENDEAASKFKLGNLIRFGKGKKQDGNENSYQPVVLCGALHPAGVSPLGLRRQRPQLGGHRNPAECPGGIQWIGKA